MPTGLKGVLHWGHLTSVAAVQGDSSRDADGICHHPITLPSRLPDPGRVVSLVMGGRGVTRSPAGRPAIGADPPR